MLIGLTGLAGSGKSVVANVLVEEFGFTRVKFADGLKNMARSLFRDMGHCADDVERMIEGDLKDAVDPELGVSPRHVMVTLGTEWGRDLIARDLWARIWSARVATLLPDARIVTDDVRFPNEVRALRHHKGVLWRIERPGLVTTGHVSEQLDAPADLTFVNDRTLEGLEAAVRGLMRRSCNSPADKIRERLAEIERERAAMPHEERAALERDELAAQRESWVRSCA